MAISPIPPTHVGHCHSAPVFSPTVTTIQGLIIAVSGQTSVVELPADDFAQLQATQQIVGGNIEHIGALAGNSEVVFICDEEAKMKGRWEPNPVATALLQQWLSAAGRGLRRGDVLPGVVVIVGGVDDEGRLTDLPAETLAAAQDFARGWLR